MRFMLEWNPDLPDAEKKNKEGLGRMMGTSEMADEVSRTWQLLLMKALGCNGDHMCDFVYLYRFDTLEQVIESNTIGNSIHTLACVPLRERLAIEVSTRGAPVEHIPIPTRANVTEEKAFFIDNFMSLSAAQKALLRERCGLQQYPPSTLFSQVSLV